LQAALTAKERINDAFPDGVYFGSLHTADSAHALIAALADSCGLSPVPGAEPRAELFRYLQTRDLLLVVDGFEHLVEESQLLCAILQHAPRVKLLVTCRQRLHLSGEWSLELGGLPYAPLGTPTGIESYSATQLFIERARQTSPDFLPSPMDLQAITYICELVEGLPLAIELAAAWIRTMPCIDIACAIEGGLDALSAFQPDRPPRHQSIRATFEHSWNLLTVAERGAFRRAAVFRDGFDRQAAWMVAGADQALLTSLVDKSLLRRSSAGRYEMHELLLQFAAQKLDLASVERDETRVRHARYYLGEFMAQREQELRGGKQAEAMERVRVEIRNLQAAWTWAAGHCMSREIGGALLPLATLYEMLGWWTEGEKAFGAAAVGLGAGSRPANERAGEERVVLGAVLATHGTFCLHLGALDRARAQLKASLELLGSVDDNCKEKAFPHLGMGLLLNTVGRSADAEEHLRRSLAILRLADDRLLAAITLDYLGEICVELGRGSEARALFEEALALHRANGEQWGVGRALYGLGQMAAGTGRLAEAQQRLSESATIFATLGAHDAAARSNCALGEVAYAAGKATQARKLLEESLPVLEQSRNALAAARCRASLARVRSAGSRIDLGETALPEDI
jgi:predicted ATPase